MYFLGLFWGMKIWVKSKLEHPSFRVWQGQYHQDQSHIPDAIQFARHVQHSGLEFKVV